MRLRSAALIPALVLSLGAQPPIQVGLDTPILLDLRDAAAAALVPGDARDVARVEQLRQVWGARIAGLKAAPSVRILLPRNADRLPLLLAASQALRAQNPGQTLYLAYDPGAPAIMAESAWGAVHGGFLGPDALGGEPGEWRRTLAAAQTQFPGRPWFLWLPREAGPEASALLGDGGRLVVPAGGAAARLASVIPPGFAEVEGGLGDLTLRDRTGKALRWCWVDGEWRSAPPPGSRHEVAVVAAEDYDIPALMALMRATQLRDRSALSTQEGHLEVDLHIQAEQGMGMDLGFAFHSFEKAGEGEELLQKELRFNGVKAKLSKGLQVPIVESRTSIAAPVALVLTERYRYEDAGPEGPNRRRVRFRPVDKDPQLYEGELVVEEATGRVLVERSERTGLPGMVKSERRVLTYGEPAPGLWRVMDTQTFERWVTPGGVAQVQRHLVYSQVRVGDPGFEKAREEARGSKATMLKQTAEGLRYYVNQPDGTRKIEEKPRSSGKGLGLVLLMDPGQSMPVMPLGGLAYFDFNALDRGIQLTGITAGVFNAGSVAVPNLAAGFDLEAQAQVMLLPRTERPVRDGELLDREGVARTYGVLSLGLARDLGLGFRVEAREGFQYDHFMQGEEKYRSSGFALPPSGWTLETRGTLRWQFRGFRASGYYGAGHRPEGTYGLASAPQAVPDEGGFRRWGGGLGYDLALAGRSWVSFAGGYAAGRGFDRFKSLSASGFGGDVRIAGIRGDAISAESLRYVKVGYTLPPLPNLRLSLSLDHARLRNLDDHQDYGFTGLGVAGDLPGFWYFTTIRLDLGIGLQSDLPDAKAVQGTVTMLRIF
ncbi:hypothetical protein [Holophaga foetida]|uniref:hypothetical protein n=1 Tax=Holophaga foetida TaxID=35839 RepID=UPI0002471CAD|nr:hypothetical protein [Holophaga foetida]